MSQLALGDIRTFAVHDPLGRCYTPQPLADAIVRAIEFEGEPNMLVEPSVGGGSLVRGAAKRWPGVHVVGVDRDEQAEGFRECDQMLLGDWLAIAEEWAGAVGTDVHHFFHDRPDLVLGNPDFGRRDCTIPLAHARACLRLDPAVCTLILPWAYLCSKTWAPFLEEHPPYRVHRIVGRVWDVVREVAAYEWRRGFRGETSTPVLQGYRGGGT